MGQQQSKSKDGDEANGGKSLERNTDSLQSYPSMSKSDTKESARSFRGVIRSKIPGKDKLDKTDSPRPSLSSIDPGNKVDGGSSRSPASKPSRPSQVSSPTTADSVDEIFSPLSPDDPDDEAQPPPSPSQSASLGRGHQSVNQAQRSGEVDHVSDEPPHLSLYPPPNATPKQSILVKKDGDSSPRTPELPKSPSSESEVASSPGIGIGNLKTPDLDDMINRLLDAGYSSKASKAVCLKNAEITAICIAVKEVLLNQPALLELSAPVKIVGDIHGQYTDLLRTFEMCGFPPNSNYLFLGDYVDRGKKSLETILLLFCYKLKYPENFFLLRGNHESANVTRVYGFYDECKRRCNVKIWKTFIDSFNCLPIAAIVASKIFCVHGGLSPSLTHMDDIRQIARPTDVPDYGLLNDLLWSDPADMEADWESNERGVSYCFGKKVIVDFLQRNDFDLVCRAHMVVEDGYEFFQDRILVTVFSAPNVSSKPPKLQPEIFALTRLFLVLWRIRQLGCRHVR